MKKKRLIVVILLLVVGLPILGVVGYRLWRGPVADTGNPRPDAAEAPSFNGANPGLLQEGEPKDIAPGGESGAANSGGGNDSPREHTQANSSADGNAQGSQGQTNEEPIDDWQRYGWPDDFKLPLEITFDDAPEVPEAVHGPLPPTEKEE